MCSITFDVEVSKAGQQWQRENTGTKALPIMCMHAHIPLTD
jgi:predicted PolB exonuclease-like 3'-5' exonuclease